MIIVHEFLFDGQVVISYSEHADSILELFGLIFFLIFLLILDFPFRQVMLKKSRLDDYNRLICMHLGLIVPA